MTKIQPHLACSCSRPLLPVPHRRPLIRFYQELRAAVGGKRGCVSADALLERLAEDKLNPRWTNCPAARSNAVHRHRAAVGSGLIFLDEPTSRWIRRAALTPGIHRAAQARRPARPSSSPPLLEEAERLCDENLIMNGADHRPRASRPRWCLAHLAADPRVEFPNDRFHDIHAARVGAIPGSLPTVWMLAPLAFHPDHRRRRHARRSTRRSVATRIPISISTSNVPVLRMCSCRTRATDLANEKDMCCFSSCACLQLNPTRPRCSSATSCRCCCCLDRFPSAGCATGPCGRAYSDAVGSAQAARWWNRCASSITSSSPSTLRPRLGAGSAARDESQALSAHRTGSRRPPLQVDRWPTGFLEFPVRNHCRERRAGAAFSTTTGWPPGRRARPTEVRPASTPPICDAAPGLIGMTLLIIVLNGFAAGADRGEHHGLYQNIKTIDVSPCRSWPGCSPRACCGLQRGRGAVRVGVFVFDIPYRIDYLLLFLVITLGCIFVPRPGPGDLALSPSVSAFPLASSTSWQIPLIVLGGVFFSHHRVPLLAAGHLHARRSHQMNSAVAGAAVRRGDPGQCRRVDAGDRGAGAWSALSLVLARFKFRW